MALANAVQNAMTGGKGNLAVGVVTLSVVVLAAWCRTRLLVRSPGLERAFIDRKSVV